MAEAGSKNLGRKIALGLAAVVLGYVVLVLVFPRVLDGYQYHALNDRLGKIESSFAVLLDRMGERSGPLRTVGPMEASLASSAGSHDERALADRLDRVTLALERLESAVEAQTHALEALTPLFEPPGAGVEAESVAGDGE